MSAPSAVPSDNVDVVNAIGFLSDVDFEAWLNFHSFPLTGSDPNLANGQASPGPSAYEQGSMEEVSYVYGILLD